MANLVIVLLFIFGGVALMVMLGQRYAKPMEPEQEAKLARWFLILAGLAIVVGLIEYVLR